MTGGFVHLQITVLGYVKEKAPAPKVVRLLGKVIEVRLVQKENAVAPISVTPSEMMTEVRSKQPANAANPILVTPSGMMTEVKPLQCWNAESPMISTLLGMTVCLLPKTKVLVAVLIRQLLSSLESNTLLSGSTAMEVNLSQLAKASGAMFESPFPIVTEERLAHP